MPIVLTSLWDRKVDHGDDSWPYLSKIPNIPIILIPIKLYYYISYFDFIPIPYIPKIEAAHIIRIIPV